VLRWVENKKINRNGKYKPKKKKEKKTTEAKSEM